MEHLGSIENGLNFILNSAKCLKKDGIAVHTPELNISNLDDTYELAGLCFFRKPDIEKLLVNEEIELFPLNWSTGNLPEDQLVDFPPYTQTPHLKISVCGVISIFLGLLMRKR